MPFVLHPRVRKGVCRLAAVTALGVLAPAGVAVAACPAQPTTPAFSALGDSNQYFAAPGGTFEGATTSWTLQNASLTAGNEPWQVNSPTDSQSLAINAGGTAYSQPFCLDSTMPSFRFFARQNGGLSNLKVYLVLSDGSTDEGSNIDNVATLLSGSAPNWTPSSQVSIAQLLNLAPGGSMQARIAFQVVDGWGGWQIDDVFVDPYRTA